MSEYEGLNAVYEDVVEPLIDAVSDLNELLGQWKNEDGEFMIGLALTDIAERASGSECSQKSTRLRVN